MSVQERQPALFHLWSVQEVSGDLERWAERKHTFQMDTQMDFLWQQMGGKELILCGAFAAAGTLAVYVGKLLHGLLYYPFPGPRGGLLGVKISAATGKTLEPLFLEHSDAEFSPVSLRIHGVLVVIIAAAVDIQKANQSRPDGLHRFPVMTLLDLKPESPGLFTAEGDEWRRQRRAYAPAFNAKNVNEMLPVIKDKTARLMRIFEQREIVTDVVDLLKLCTADIICEAALGLDFNRLERAQEDDDDEKEDELRALPRLLQQRFSVSMRKLVRNAHLAILAWLTPRWFCSRWDAVREFFQIGEQVSTLTARLVRRKLDEIKQDPSKAKAKCLMDQAVLQMLREDGDLWTDRQALEVLNSNMATFFTAGSDTTAHSTAWFLYFLCAHPDWQRKSREQLARVLGGRDWATLTSEELKELTVLRACLLESLRLEPTVATFGARVNAPDFSIRGRAVPRGSVVIQLMRLATSRAPGLKEPEAFKPERWLDPATGALRSEREVGAGVVVFGGGPRACPGRLLAEAEMLTIAAAALARFGEWEMAQAADEVGRLDLLTVAPGPLTIRFCKGGVESAS